jgi:hypothetical protein
MTISSIQGNVRRDFAPVCRSFFAACLALFFGSSLLSFIGRFAALSVWMLCALLCTRWASHVSDLGRLHAWRLSDEGGCRINDRAGRAIRQGRTFWRMPEAISFTW